MSTPIKIFIENRAYEGKLIENDKGFSLLFSTENGRYFVNANPTSIKISLSGEVGYDLKIEKFARSSFSLCYGETHTYPSDLTLLSYAYSYDGKRGEIAVSYALAPDGYDEDEDETTQSFEISFYCV